MITVKLTAKVQKNMFEHAKIEKILAACPRTPNIFHLPTALLP